MAKFDIIVSKKENYKGYTGNPPSNESEYDAMKTDMFSGSPPTWTELKNEMDSYVDPKVSARTKLMNGESLTEEEANAITL